MKPIPHYYLTFVLMAGVALALTTSAAHGQAIVNCCMPDGSCQTVFGSCEDIGGVQTDQFCSNCGCAGNCGGSALACWCDSACHQFGDCCNDVCDHCTGPQVPACSCQGNCGGNSGAFPNCWCDSACFNFGDCCLDVCDHCFGSFPEQCSPCIGNTCATAEPVTDGTTNNHGIAGCTASGTNDSCSIAGKDRWFAYTATCNGVAKASVCVSDDIFITGDVALTVFDGCPAQGGVELACGNDHPNTFCVASPSAFVSWPAFAGQTYYIRLTGDGTLATVTFECEVVAGACCFGSFTSDCDELIASDCAVLGGEWLGALASCVQCACDAWHDVSGGTNSGVFAITEYDNNLIAGGQFSSAGGSFVNSIAWWNGTTWHPFVSGGSIGVSSSVHALTEHNGNLIAGGQFSSAGGQTVNYIARWDGSSWHALTAGGQTGVGGGAPGLEVLAVADFNGDLIVGGTFTTAGSQTVNRIARWDGSAWHPFVAGGQTGVGGSSSPVPTVLALGEYNGDLIVGGFFPTAGGQTVNHIARWDGTAWHPLASGGQTGVSASGPVPSVRAVVEYNGDLIVGGTFHQAGGQTVNHIARWDGTAWHPLTSGGQIGLSGSDGGITTGVAALTVYNGDLIATGHFTMAGGQTVDHIARWDGSAWHPFVMDGQAGVDATVRALTLYDGDLVAGGFFTMAGGQEVNRIARWRDCGLAQCGDSEAGDCFAINGSPSCDQEDCCATICAQDPFCCGANGGTWDEICMIQAEALCTGPPAGECGSPLSGDCFAVSNTPGCASAACCEAVCKIDGFCCKTAWDDICVQHALDICTEPGFMNTAGTPGTFTDQGAHGLFRYEIEYFNGSIIIGDLCCGLDELPQTVTAHFIVDIFDGIGTTPGYTGGMENVVAFSLQFGDLHWTELLLFDIQLDIVGPNMATELTWVGTRLDTPCDPNDPFGPFCGTSVPLNFPLTFKGENADGEPYEILYTDSTCELIPTTCQEIGCCEGHCGGMSPLGCACDADCVNRGDCCSDMCATCGDLDQCPICPADLNCDGVVDGADLLILLSAWGECADPNDCPADLNEDGVVDGADLLILLSNWG